MTPWSKMHVFLRFIIIFFSGSFIGLMAWIIIYDHYMRKGKYDDEDMGRYP